VRDAEQRLLDEIGRKIEEARAILQAMDRLAFRLHESMRRGEPPAPITVDEQAGGAS
jgi:hypothetical protein